MGAWFSGVWRRSNDARNDETNTHRISGESARQDRKASAVNTSKPPLPADEVPPPPLDKHRCKRDVNCQFRKNGECPAKGCRLCMMIAVKKPNPWADRDKAKVITRTVCRSCKVRVNWCARCGVNSTFGFCTHANADMCLSISVHRLLSPGKSLGCDKQKT